MTIATKTLTALESGDRLSREEFHQRYLERPEIKRAELVEGVVYVTSPVRANVHAEPNGCMVVWIGSYRARHPECGLVRMPPFGSITATRFSLMRICCARSRADR